MGFNRSKKNIFGDQVLAVLWIQVKPTSKQTPQILYNLVSTEAAQQYFLKLYRRQAATYWESSDQHMWFGSKGPLKVWPIKTSYTWQRRHFQEQSQGNLSLVSQAPFPVRCIRWHSQHSPFNPSPLLFTSYPEDKMLEYQTQWHPIYTLLRTPKTKYLPDPYRTQFSWITTDMRTWTFFWSSVKLSYNPHRFLISVIQVILVLPGNAPVLPHPKIILESILFDSWKVFNKSNLFENLVLPSSQKDKFTSKF